MALVEFVEHDGADASEVWVTGEAAVEDAFGHVAQPGLGAGEVFKAHLVADAFADALATFAGDATCGEARCEASWFEYDDVAIDAIHEVCRHASCLAGTGRGFNYGVPFEGEIWEEVVYR
jgi:hypothetical protein